MAEPLKLMAVFAHPDDESLGCGGALAHYAAQGVETALVCATRGERGWGGPPQDFPGLEALGRLREAELRAAAGVLGLGSVEFLDYLDGELDQADPGEAIARITARLRRFRPQVVITFGPEGAYGHPDHIAISQLTTAAVVCAADPAYRPEQGPAPHRVAKLYYAIDTQEARDLVAEHFGGITFEVDGVPRSHVGWPEWAVTARIDARAHWRTAWQAILRHHSQVGWLLETAEKLPEAVHARLWGVQTFCRAYSLVNGGRQVEEDLFAGLR
jgi:LmbE family N-acetylglucosaminyl deacetylase